MAYLIELDTDNVIYLHAHHSFGRFQYSVDTLVVEPSVSKIHCIIEWQGSHWQVRDLSRNGTWLNSKRLEKDRPEILHCNDLLTFPGNSSRGYRVANLDKPEDMLIILNSLQRPTEQYIPLSSYNLIPDEQPEIAVFIQRESGFWCFERLDGPPLEHTIIIEHDRVSDSRHTYQLHLSHSEAATALREVASVKLADLNFIFNLTLDEESAELVIKGPNEEVDLGERCHHYLTLNLARYKAQDAAQGVHELSQGWVDTEVIAKDLGIDSRYLNIQIHRARKQFSDALAHVEGADHVIERKLRKVRFNASNFEIYKGHQLEGAINSASN
ncbi:FHA domain-containing protein [Pseudoalteromonas sp. YIC-827]|uniref:FHA domain-containing protein n=1 Tax=Pseudoalteromonas qingdaonensis TaxID=3131913 RepID=A0ABU9MUJ7_9GAMM